jgi:hypothetical protein
VYVSEHVYFSGPGARIVTGIEILARIINPALFSGIAPERVVHSFQSSAIPVRG